MALLDFSEFAEPAGSGAAPKPPLRPVTSGGVDFSAYGTPESLYKSPMFSRAPGGEKLAPRGTGDAEGQSNIVSRFAGAALQGANANENLAKDYLEQSQKFMEEKFGYGTPGYVVAEAFRGLGTPVAAAWDAFGRAIGAGANVAGQAAEEVVRAADETFGKSPYARPNDAESVHNDVVDMVNMGLIAAGMPEIHPVAVRPDLGVRPEVRDFLKTAEENPPPPKPKSPIGNYTEAVGYPSLPAPGAEAPAAAAPEAPKPAPAPPPPPQAPPRPPLEGEIIPPQAPRQPAGAPPGPPPTIDVTANKPARPPVTSGGVDFSQYAEPTTPPPAPAPSPRAPQPAAPAPSPSPGAAAPVAEAKPVFTPAPAARPAFQTPPAPSGAPEAGISTKPAVGAPETPSGPQRLPAPSVPPPAAAKPTGAPVETPPVINLPGPANIGNERQLPQIAAAHWHGNEEVAALEPARVQEEMARPEVQAEMAKPVRIDRSYDIPYLAGYSKDGSTFYIDRHLPQEIPVDGRQVNTDRLVPDHEQPEKALESLGYKYQFRHEIASGHEDARLRADNIDPAAYNKALAPFIKHAEHERLSRVPADLDLSPYSDSDARSIEARMAKAEEAPAVSPAVSSAAPDPLRQRIRDAYFALTGGKTNERVWLSDLRKQLGDVPRQSVDDALRKMHLEDGSHLSAWENPRDVTPERKAGGVDFKGFPQDGLWITKREPGDSGAAPSAEAKPVPPKKPPTPQVAPDWGYVLPSFVTDQYKTPKPPPVAKPKPEKSEWTKLGKNDTGRMLFQDQRGVRSYVSDGIRHTEPVAIRPDGGISTRPDRGEWTLASEKPAEAPAPVVPAPAEKPPRSEVRLPATDKEGRPKGPKVIINRIPTESAAEKPTEHPGLVIHSLETGKETIVQPPGTVPPKAAATSTVDLANALRYRLNMPLSMKDALAEAARAYGGTLAEGKFDRKDVYDAIELAVNLNVRDDPNLRVDNGDWEGANAKLKALLDRLPTQTVRSEEQQRFQQFSTPPNYAAAVAYAANLRGSDVVMEPSAGTGSILAASMRPGVTLIANELSGRRAELLKDLIGPRGRVFQENAEQIDNILPESVKPTVVVMNPPFSQTAGRMGDKKELMTGAKHIEQALSRLEPGGRLVAIVGGGTDNAVRSSPGMSFDAPKYRDWWNKIRAANDVKANVLVEGSLYQKYGTGFRTRLIVIDKVPPSGNSPYIGTASTIPDLFKALEGIRDARPAGKRPAGEPSGVAVAENRPAEARPVAPVSSEPRPVGPGPERPGGVPAAGPVGAGEPGGRPVRVGGEERPSVAPQQPERPVAEGAGEGTPPVAPEREQPGGGGEPAPRSDIQPATGGEPGATAGGERASLETVAPGQQSTGAITDSLYEPYQPQRVRIAGARPHPGPLVQSAAMSSVDPPVPTYQTALPKDVIDKGLLSTAQLEAVVYAGQSHARTLPAAEGETGVRRGFFIGDGTGVGKGREVAGIVLDNWQQGRTKHVWVSEKKTLLEDARRDWSGLGQNPNHIFDLGKTKTGEPVSAKQGIAFVTYDTLKGGMSDQAALAKGGLIRKQAVTVNGRSGIVQSVSKGKDAQAKIKFDNGDVVTVPIREAKPVEGAAGVKTRVDQLADWLGPNFDGVIAFDEAHNMGNAINVKGDRGVQEAAQKALAGIALQQRLPNARVVYVSATGATEVSNLAYADRLGLWGRGTPFADRNKFISDIESGGIAAMELVARDMKQLGLYTARNLSYDGVEYQRLEHKLEPAQREIYDQLAESWQVVLRNMEKALELTGGDQSRAAKNAAKSAFWSSHQRFFNQIITSLQMPSVVKGVERDLAEGRQAVLQLTNTNEASQERAAAKAQSADEIEDLDITPRDMVIQLVEKSFPTQQYEEYIDEDGNERTRPVTDAEGKPVENREAVAMRAALIDKLASIRLPQGPLDMILDHFGIDTVAEVTGRGRRFVMKPDPQTGRIRRVEEPRPASANLGETQAFQSGKKRILVFSEAGGTGRSYHADNTSPSKDARRSHYLVQAGWRADKAVQGFGRTHRTNQASAPIFTLVTTDLQGQKRFISSIARRLSQLGALTKGQRQAGDQGIFSARDNLESQEANIALQQFYSDLIGNRIDGVNIDDFENQTGLQLRQKDEEGGVVGVKQNLPPITQFLNRLLSMKIDMQNRVFDAFAKRMDDVIEMRRQAGLLDLGLETVKADKITKNSERTVHTDPETGAETDHVKLTLADRFHPRPFQKGDIGWAQAPKGKVYAVELGPTHTDARTGELTDQYRLRSPVASSRNIPRHTLSEKNGWRRLEEAEARKLWQDETAKAPEFIERDLHLITGAILPIWDRLKGSTRVVRLQTDAGERFIGRVVPDSQVAGTLEALGAKGETQTVTPAALFDRLMQGGSATLSNGWRLKRSLVAGEDRIELVGPSSFGEGEEVKKDGVFTERIQSKMRYFVPTGEDGPAVLERLTKFRPVTQSGEGRGGNEPEFGDRSGSSLRDFMKSEEGALHLNRLFGRAARGQITPPLTRAQARARKQAEKSFPVTQRYKLDKTTRELAARAEEVRQMADKFVKALRKAGIKTDAQKFALHQKITKFQENVNHPENQPKLTPTERKLYDEHYKPLFDLHDKIYRDVMALKHLMSDEQRAAYEDLGNPEYVHHVVAGKGSRYDRIAREVGYGPILGRSIGTGEKGLPTSASAMKESTYYALENDRTGERIIVSKGENGLTRWENGEAVTGKGKFPNVDLKVGKSFKTKAGDRWTVQRAKLEEKMEHVPHDYYQNAYATTADSVLALEHAKLGLQYFDQLTKTPEWLEKATRAGNQEPPDGWERIDKAPLIGWYLHPDIYRPLKDYYGGDPILKLSEGKGRIKRGLGSFLDGLNRILTQSIFISPIPHLWNVVNHWVIDRGWDWASVPAYGRLAITGAQALKSVIMRDERYQQMLRDGAPLFYSNARNNNLMQHIFDRTGAEMEANPEGGFWGAAAKAFKIPPLSVIPWFYRGVNEMMWMGGDVLMMQRILELERGSSIRKPMTSEAAIARARGHIPDYVVPPTVAGSRLLSRVLQDKTLTMFGRYRYSQWKSLFHDFNETFGRGKSAEQRAAALGRLLAAYVMFTGIYSLLDEYIQKLLGIPKAQIVRGGPFHLIENLETLYNKPSAGGLGRFLYTTFIPSPIVEAAIELYINHDLWRDAFGFRSKPYTKKTDTLPEAALHNAEGIGASLGVGSDIARAREGNWRQVLGQQMGVKIPYRPVR